MYRRKIFILYDRDYDWDHSIKNQKRTEKQKK